MATILLGVEYFDEWVEEETCWNWYGKSKEVVPIAVSIEITLIELIDEIIINGNLSCSRGDIVVKYLMGNQPLHYKVPPVVLNSEKRLRCYMLDVDEHGRRPTLRVSIVDKPLELGSKEGENDRVGVETIGFDLFVQKSGVGANLLGEQDTINEAIHEGQINIVNEEETIHVPVDVVPINTVHIEGAISKEEEEEEEEE